MTSVEEPVKAILLDDYQTAREQATEFFEQEGIELTTVANKKDFLAAQLHYPIMLCDLDLRNISSNENGVAILQKIRINNKVAFLAVYSAYTDKITQPQEKELNKQGIWIYSKQDAVTQIKNLLLHYIEWRKTNAVNKEKHNNPYTETKSEHYIMNKDITLHHLKKISNKNIKLPIIALQETFSYDELINEIEHDTPTGNAFILEFMQSIARFNEVTNKQRV